MFIAEMHSETKDWVALAETEMDAKEAIREKWNRDQVTMQQNGWLNYPNLFSSVKKLEEVYDIDVTEIEIGECVMI